MEAVTVTALYSIPGQIRRAAHPTEREIMEFPCFSDPICFMDVEQGVAPPNDVPRDLP
jgi:hypothetical protein